MGSKARTLRAMCVDLVKLIRSSDIPDELLADVIMARFMDYMESRVSERASVSSFDGDLGAIAIDPALPIKKQVEEQVPEAVRKAFKKQTGIEVHEMLLDKMPKDMRSMLPPDSEPSRGKVETTTDDNIITPTVWGDPDETKH